MVKLLATPAVDLVSAEPLTVDLVEQVGAATTAKGGNGLPLISFFKIQHCAGYRGCYEVINFVGEFDLGFTTELLVLKAQIEVRISIGELDAGAFIVCQRKCGRETCR